MFSPTPTKTPSPAARGIALITAVNRATRRLACWSSAPPTIAPWKRPARIAAETEVDVAAKEGAHIGPVVSATQRDKIRRLIAAGIGRALGRGRGGRAAAARSRLLRAPDVFADVTNEMTVAREEIFGPVLSIMPFDDEEEATRIANDTPYGLGNYIQTRDAAKAARIARRLRSGMVQINGHSLADAAPFGGYKRSGNGREGGAWGIEEFLETKAVSGWE